MAVQINLFQIIFEEFLKISPNLISNYSTIQDQLLYLVLIPHVILFLFLAAFGLGLMGRVFGKPHHGFQLLVIIISYIYIVWSGWYGSFIVPFTITWFLIALVIGLFLFFINAVFSLKQLYGIPKLIGEGGKLLGAPGGKGEAIDRLRKQRIIVEKQIDKYDKLIDEMRIGKLTGDIGKVTGEQDKWVEKLHQIDEKIEELEKSW